MTLVSLFIPEVHGDGPKDIDFFGMILSGAALSLLMFGFETASHPGQLQLALELLVSGTAIGAAYLAHARRIEHPILDFKLFKVRTFGTSLMAGSFSRVTQGSQAFLLALLLQLGFASPPCKAARSPWRQRWARC